MQSDKNSTRSTNQSDTPVFTYEDYITSQLNRSLVKASYDTSTQTEYLLSHLWPMLGSNNHPRVLCVGCRNSYELDKIEQAGASQVVGIDLHSNDPRILVMDMHVLQFPDASFDVVYSCHSLEYALEPEKVCKEFVRVLKPGGFIVVEVPVGFHTQDISGIPTWDTAITGPTGRAIIVPRNDKGLVPDIWDLKDQHHLEQMLLPLKTQWSETGNAILNPQQRTIRIISKKEPPSVAPGGESTMTESAPAPFTIVNPCRLSEMELSPCFHDLQYSMRRYFVDEFYTRRVQQIPAGSRVLDMGGKKARKRGQFNIEKYPFQTKYVNLDPASEPDYLADVAAVPVPDHSFDVVILAEVVEHLQAPERALREAGRILKKGGLLLATAPFMYRLHADPIDVGRYMPQWWAERLANAGFTAVEIEPQGLFFSTMVDLARDWIRDLTDRNALWPGAAPYIPLVVQMARQYALSLEQQKSPQSQHVVSEISTGYGVCARRA